MRVLLDTNVLFAAFTAHGVCHAVYEHCLQQEQLITSPHILAELSDVLPRKANQTKSHTQEIIRALKDDCELVKSPDCPQPVSRDPDDDWVLAAAIEGKADVLITGDKDLLVLKKHKGIPIITPREFLELISGNKS